MARASIKENLLNNALLYYTYDIQEEDTPEIVAHKYYGDVYRYWIILFTNQIMDPQWNWPLSGKNFEKYISAKYGNNDPTNLIQHYEKVITTLDRNTKTETVNRIIIDEETYNNLYESENGYVLPSGVNVIVKIEKNIVSKYQYELDLNESKRNIKILNKAYANQLEQELELLME